MPLLLAHFNAFRSLIIEGINDPGILKCVFMAGGPGSGKSSVSADLFGIDSRFRSSFSSFGLKLVNSDSAFEVLLHKNGVNPKELADIERNDPAQWDRLTGDNNSLRQQAKRLSNAQKALYMQGRLGLIVDGTGDDVGKIARQRQEAEVYGYDTMMVFVNTTLETSLARNAARSRRLPDSLVTQIWQASQRNLDAFAGIFGSNFLVVENDVPRGSDPEMEALMRKLISQFVRRPVQNPAGQAWMASARRMMGA